MLFKNHERHSISFLSDCTQTKKFTNSISDLKLKKEQYKLTHLRYDIHNDILPGVYTKRIPLDALAYEEQVVDFIPVRKLDVNRDMLTTNQQLIQTRINWA